MCGIVGYVGERPCKELLLTGLERLEYRGYDSAGICLINGEVDITRRVGRVQELRDAVGSADHPATTGLAHTRWATHGGVTESNAHPIEACQGSGVTVVHNGIIENYQELRGELAAAGHTFHTDTDTEVIAHLVEEMYSGDLVEAVRAAYARLHGHFAIGVAHRDHPHVLVGARRQCPLVVGVGEGETFMASAIPAFMGETRRVQYVLDGEIVIALPGGARFLSDGGDEIDRLVEQVDWDEDAAEKQGYETFMLKEIHEQPDAIAETIGERLYHGALQLDGLNLSDERIRSLNRIVMLACGTSYHAGLVGRYLLEEWARVPCESDIASEWRYRHAVIDENTLVVGVAQSGETIDTLAAMKEARSRGAHVLAITNVMGSQMTRECDSVLFTRAGLEIGVAATKTFTAQVTLMYLLALKLGLIRGTIEEGRAELLLEQVKALPDLAQRTIDAEDQVTPIAERYWQSEFFLYLGRNIGLPIALEGALKLKEISYIATDAYAAGEMKHGPIALLDSSTPVVCIATDNHVFEKMVSNIEEVRARGAHVIAVATEGDARIEAVAEHVIWLPRTEPELQAVLAVIPLQQLAYQIARKRGLDADKPRNLAKTVTVE
ncbi:MAG TPA: glutamine--fructose-6-phosphate transaminase (isomerizing) [Gaiellales bacterium]|jgi:glucosamine--fructose-6-phosphate aminotransferase (isomerizing)|nr:glutamine--fructose-6-phosphate transaminase (isomerizing) [Gaiellales bacterium]